MSPAVNFQRCAEYIHKGINLLCHMGALSLAQSFCLLFFLVQVFPTRKLEQLISPKLNDDEIWGKLNS